ncbi:MULTISPECIES: ABC transporter substrate-binding protein [Marinobacter]|uniref:ABC transporter substrate-binding protein n=1 Tax=Marinobacter TaxID=2742 RepID=UPI001245FB34|nr:MULTISPECIES: ABC transporter substrate-binding protein [Marinobacter]MBJ7275813.1 ABC transporter substrate-binding protein [Marinobacter salarius]MBL3558975.1 ABC transporter substrate-binding protein [Marinobacter sp. JB05H06]
MTLRLSLAIDRYDRFFPFFDETVQTPDSVSLDVYQVGQTVPLRDGEFRHERMIYDEEFDVCEFSFSSFIMAKKRGLPIVGIPVFPRRLFSVGLWYVRRDSALRSLSDLRGKRVGLNSFQTTLSVLAKGDLKFEYGVPWESMEWHVLTKEKIEFEPKKGTVIRQLKEGSDLGKLLEKGEIDAFIHPHPPKSITSGQVPVRRLAEDAAELELSYYHKHGYCPIMHVIAIRQTLAERHPWVCDVLMNAFHSAQTISDNYYNDPNWSKLFWGRRYWETERDALQGDPWPIGLAANRSNIERFLTYSQDQGLISAPISVDALFAESTLYT